MSDKKQKTPDHLYNAFSTGGQKPADPVVQDRVTRECQHPATPFKITDEDWKYGIGLN